MEKKLRFQLFLDRLANADPASSFQEARRLMDDILNAIEDEHSGVPFDPGKWKSDGRMYPPQDDRERPSGNPHVRIFETRGHLVELADNGAIRIRALRNGLPLPDKAGANGRTIGVCSPS